LYSITEKISTATDIDNSITHINTLLSSPRPPHPESMTRAQDPFHCRSPTLQKISWRIKKLTKIINEGDSPHIPFITRHRETQKKLLKSKIMEEKTQAWISFCNSGTFNPSGKLFKFISKGKKP